MKLFGHNFLKIAVLLVALSAVGSAAVVVIDGTDANDHGSAGSGGWLYMRAVLNNINTELGAGTTKTLTVLGTDSGTQSRDAIDWSFTNSTLATAGWTVNYVSAANVGTFLPTLSTANTGLLYIPTVGNADGDLPDSAITTLTSNAAIINAYTAAGGGLYTQAESPVTTGISSYQWLSSLVPGISITDAGSGGFSSSSLTLTADGMTDFPGLSNADLSAGPYHNFFGGSFGGLSVLATGFDDAGNVVPVVIGAVGSGSISMPSGAPEPSTWLLMGVGLAACGLYTRRRKSSNLG